MTFLLMKVLKTARLKFQIKQSHAKEMLANLNKFLLFIQIH